MPSSVLHDIELEKRVLGAVLIDPDVILPLRRALLPDDFFEPKHRVIFEVMLQCLDEKIRPSVDNVVLVLGDQGWEKRAGGLGYVASLGGLLVGAGPSPSLDAPVWGERLAGLANRRALFRLGGEMQQKAQDMKVAHGDLWAEVVSVVVKGKERSAEDFRTFGSVVQEAMKTVRSWLKGEHPDTVTTGLVALDFAMGGGLPRRMLTILGGRPGAGKTLLAETIAKAVEEAGGIVGFSSLEMAAHDLVVRDLCREAGVNSLRLRRGDFAGDPFVEQNLLEAAKRVEKRSQTYVDDDPMRLTTDMHYSATMLALEKGRLDLHIVDYVELLGDVRGPEGEGDDRAGVVMSYRRLKALAKSVGCAELVLSQLSRASLRRPRLSGLMWGGEPIADVVLMAYWPWKLERQGEMKKPPKDVDVDLDGKPLKDQFLVMIQKARHGDEGMVKLLIDPAMGLITDPGYTVAGKPPPDPTFQKF